MPVSESEVVVLESPAVLAQLLSMWPASIDREYGRRRAQTPSAEPRPTNPRPAQSPPGEPEQTHQSRSRLCSCGTCGRCRDNDRWNRIFDEKFADPSYYGRVSIRHNSSLAGV